MARRSETSSTYPRPHDTATIAHVDISDCEHCTQCPNRWSKIRAYIREPAAEFLGSMIFVIIGCGSNCQVVLSTNPAVASSPKGEFLSTNFGWAIGLSLGVWTCAGISGGHVNPAVTLAFAFWGQSVVLVLFTPTSITPSTSYEGGPGIRTISGTGDLFGAYAADYMTSVSCFFSEFLGAAILILAILAATDKNNGPPPPGLVPLVIFLTILGISVALGMQTGGSVNPARDLGPRILTAMVGYGKDVFDYRNQYWIWCTLLGPILGMQAGALAYDTLVYTGSDSIVNKPDAETERQHLQACSQQGIKEHAGMQAV
ncbi:major intrinsic protein superfamily membrane channel protein [Melanogaster broomeanus]|nr:major intrinsic protein superfamily membrane channel protein [Melanogaster broomeanus]